MANVEIRPTNDLRQVVTELRVCGFQLATGRTQARVERRAAGRVCPICRDDDAA